jgi:hypothetical protein
MKIIALASAPQYRDGLDSDQPAKGDIVKFHTPLEDEDADQEYVLLDDPAVTPRVDIQALGTGMRFAPISRVLATDLKVHKKMIAP